MEWFRACFAELEDPRTGNAQRHELDEIVMIALLATVCGAEGCVDMALFGRSKEPLLRQFLRLPGGIPSHDTFSRIFRLLDSQPCRNGSKASSRSTARRRAAPSTASRAVRPCI